MSDWKNVQYKDGKMRTSEGGGGGGSSTFAGLDDVSFNNLQNGQVPKYNSTTHKWENANESGGGGTVTDVTVDGVSVVNQQGVAEIEMPTPPMIPVEDVEVNGESVVNAQKVAEIKSYKEVTQAEYNALPASKTSDGILYCIKDSAGADGFPPLIYSTNEREVGVWHNGKPLYEKTISRTFSANEVYQIATGIDEMFLVNVMFDYASGRRFSNIYISTANIQACRSLYLETSNGTSTATWQSSAASNNVTFTVRYTKTTDIAGSGSWTTDGTYAHHYSTSEKVVGTWIDGKPLYEKTITGGSVSTNQEVHIDVSSLNIERMVGVDSGGTYFVREGQYTADIPLNYNVPASANYGISIGRYGTYLSLNTGSFSISSYAITLRYTKTTD